MLIILQNLYVFRHMLIILQFYVIHMLIILQRLYVFGYMLMILQLYIIHMLMILQIYMYLDIC